MDHNENKSQHCKIAALTIEKKTHSSICIPVKRKGRKQKRNGIKNIGQ